MKSKAIIFVEPGKAVVEEKTIEPSSLLPRQVLIKTEASLVSAGTELAILAGKESWAPLPTPAGYANVGRIVAIGSEVTKWKEGDRVFSLAKHASLAVADSDRMIMAVPDAIPARDAVLVRLGQVAFTAVRISEVELGDSVAIQGLGLVGNLAGQLMRLSGAAIIGLDPSAQRRTAADLSGFELTIDPASSDPAAAVRAFAGKTMCEAVVEASGVPDLVPSAMRLAGPQGEVILLGTPRGEMRSNPMEILDRVHLWPSGCITLKGAHEWRFPLWDSGDGRVKHSLERNNRIFIQLLAAGRICTEPLVTHFISPERCTETYSALAARDESYFGVVWDWTKFGG